MKLVNLVILIFLITLFQACTLDQTKETAGLSSKVLAIQQTTKHLNIVGHWLHEGKRENLIRDLANEYEFLNQDCKVNFVFPENIYWQNQQYPFL